MPYSRSKYMSHHEIPQKRERQQKLKHLALSHNSPYLYSPYLSLPLATSTKKGSNPTEVERWDPAVR
jgi:hypothetical protein